MKAKNQNINILTDSSVETNSSRSKLFPIKEKARQLKAQRQPKQAKPVPRLAYGQEEFATVEPISLFDLEPTQNSGAYNATDEPYQSLPTGPYNFSSERHSKDKS